MFCPVIEEQISSLVSLYMYNDNYGKTHCNSDQKNLIPFLSAIQRMMLMKLNNQKRMRKRARLKLCLNQLQIKTKVIFLIRNMDFIAYICILNLLIVFGLFQSCLSSQLCYLVTQILRRLGQTTFYLTMKRTPMWISFHPSCMIYVVGRSLLLI